MYELTDCHFNETQAARYLGKSTRWLQYQLAGPNPPPSFKVGKSRVLRKSELDTWLEKFRAGSDINHIVDEVMRDLGAGE